MTNSGAKTILGAVRTVVMIFVVAFVAYLIALFTVPPTFYVDIREGPRGEYELSVAPNFVVHAFSAVKISDKSGILASLDEPGHVTRRFRLPSRVKTGDLITVECLLVYDRPMPSGRTVTKSTTVP